MTSSGIKRGLASTAIAALAVSGAPLLASTASAAAGDEIQFVSAGPTLNHGTVGGEIHVKLKGITEAELDSDLTVYNTALTTDDANSPTQTVALKDPSYVYIANGDPGDSNPNDGYAEAIVLVALDTPADGGTATYALVVDDNNDGTVQATEARTQVTQSTSGALKTISVTPASQTSPENVESGSYNVVLKDAAGRTTQLNSGETVAVTPSSGTVTVSDNSLDENDLIDGTDAVSATGTTAGNYTIAFDSAAYTGEQTTVDFKVTPAASLDGHPEYIDIVTGADTWDGFGGGSDGGTTAVQVDQSTIRIDIDAPDSQANTYVQADVTNVDGNPNNNVTFGGQNSASYSTTLDAHGNGSVTIQVDPNSIQEFDEFTLDMNGFQQTFDFERSDVSAGTITADQDPYFCQLKSSCTVTAHVADQFGNPVTTGYVEGYIYNGPDQSTAPYQRKAVGSDGSVSFTFTDTEATNGDISDIEFDYYPDQFSNSSSNSGYTSIKWTTTGQGADYVISVNGDSSEGATYNPADENFYPLADAFDNGFRDNWGPGDEDASITLSNCEPGQSVTLSVDNGALILTGTDDELSQGEQSVTAQCGFGTLTDNYYVIGTKSGLVTLTVDSANRTETAQMTVNKNDAGSEARNVSVSGPATVPHGTTQIGFTALVTDAFGNGVQNVPAYCLNVQVTGPAQFQDGDVMTDADGMYHFNVKVDADATGTVTAKVTGLPDTANCNAQFGAAADRLYASSTSDDAVDLPVSANVGSASTEVEAAPAPPQRVNPALSVRGRDNGPKADKIVARAINLTAGATVRLFRKTPNGLKLIETSTMNSKGNHKFVGIKDKNGNARTKYIVKVDRTAYTYKGIGGRKVR